MPSISSFISLLRPAQPYTGISDAASEHAEANYRRILTAQFFNKLADTLASAKVVLPWIMSVVGAPLFLSGLLVPIRESGSLLPQVIIGGRVRRYEHRKWLFVIGTVVQGLAVIGMAVAALTLSGTTAGLTIIALLALLSLARGLCSLTSKDVLGKTIPKSSRGRLMGLSASLSGLVGIAVGVVAYLDLPQAQGGFYFLLLAAAGCWVLTALVYATVREFAGESDAGRGAMEQIRRSLALLKRDAPFRRFVLVRTLMMSSGLSAPYIVLLAQSGTNPDSLRNLGLFIVTSGVASFISSNVWGRAADQSSKRVLLLTSILTAVVCVLVAGYSYFDLQRISWLAAALFFALSVVHQGVRLGRKTYIVNMAEGNQRTDYIATSNSAIGVLLLTTGVFGALAAQISITLVMLIFALMAVGATLLGRSLPDI